MIIVRCLRALCVLLILTTAGVQTGFGQSDYEKITEVEGVSEYRLANGCRLLLLPDASSSSITVNMTVFVGSRHEGYGETGMAHLLEHMLFKGTPEHPDIDKELKEKGVLNMNGTTNYDRTNYYETLPASEENMDWMISMEADRLVNCFVRAEDLASEMTVVRSEFERGENSPIAILMQRLMANAYEWHNYGKTVIGNKADIERVPIYSLKRFYRKYYRPDNVMVIVSGNFDPEKAVDSAVKHFGSLDNPEGELEKTWTTEPTQDGERIVYLNRTGDVPVIGVGYHIPAVAHPDYAAVQVLDWILGDEPSGRLYQSLVKSKQASTVFTMAQSGYDPGMQLCFAMVEDDVDLDEFRASMVEAIEQVADEGVTDEEVARAVADIGKEKEDDPTDSEDFADTLSDWAANGDWRLYFIDRDRIAEVTAADVQRVAKQYLKRSNRTVGIFVPEENPDRSTIPSTPRIADLVNGYKGRKAVSAGEAFEPTPENIASRIERGELESGVKFAILPKQTRGERFYLTLTLRYGSEDALNDPQTIQSCQILPSMLTKGTTSLDRQQLDDRTTALKCDIAVGGGYGNITVAVEGRKEYLSETLDLVIDIIRNPVFPNEELELLKSETISGIEAAKSNPQFLASLALRKRLSPVGPDSIHYVTDADENIARVNSVTVESVKAVYDKFVNGANGELTAVGAIDRDLIVSKIETVLAGWESEEPYERIKEVYFEFEPESITIETPDKANALMLMAANLQVKSDDPDWEALYIANDILGGGSLSSRLGERVREQEGLSYAVGSQFRAGSMDRSGVFMTFAITNPANRDKLLATVSEVFDKYLEEGITDAELDAAKTTYAKTLEDSFSDEKQLLGILHRYQQYGRDETFLRNRLSRVANLTKEEVNSAAHKLANDRKFVVITAGDFANAKKEDAVDKAEVKNDEEK